MTKLDHIAVEVSDIDRAIEFYTLNLGFALKSRVIDEAHNEEYCLLESQGTKIELLKDLTKQYISPKQIESPFCPHICFASDDLEKTIRDLALKQIDIIHGPLKAEGEAAWLYISDPDGNIIEYVQWLK